MTKTISGKEFREIIKNREDDVTVQHCEEVDEHGTHATILELDKIRYVTCCECSQKNEKNGEIYIQDYYIYEVVEENESVFEVLDEAGWSLNEDCWAENNDEECTCECKHCKQHRDRDAIFEGDEDCNIPVFKYEGSQIVKGYLNQERMSNNLDHYRNGNYEYGTGLHAGITKDAKGKYIFTKETYHQNDRDCAYFIDEERVASEIFWNRFESAEEILDQFNDEKLRQCYEKLVKKHEEENKRM